MATDYNPKIVRDGLLLYLDAANTRSYPGTGSTWSDLSSNKTAQFNVAPTYDSQNNGSFSFNGTTQYANVDSTNRILSNVTYTKQVWFNTSNASASNNIVSSSRGEHFLYLNGIARPWAGHPPDFNGITSPTTLLANTWYNVAVTFNSSVGWNLYLNGVLNNTTANLTTFSQLSDISIGAFSNGSNFSGKISNVLVYNRVLTLSEVRQNFNATKGRYGL